MSSNEALPQPERKFHDVGTITEIGPEYCDALTRTYGPEKMRIMLQANYFFAWSDEPAAHRHFKKTRKKGYEKVEIAGPDSDGQIVDGLFVGATMVGVKTDFWYIEDIPHAVLKDAKLVADDIPLTEGENEIIMVPFSFFDPYDRITFYR